MNCLMTVLKIDAEMASLIPRHEGGGERAPGTHCSHMHVIIAKATWQNYGCVLIAISNLCDSTFCSIKI